MCFSKHGAVLVRHRLKMNAHRKLFWNKRKTSVNEPEIIIGNILLNKVQFSLRLLCVLPYFDLFQDTECVVNK